VLAVAARAGALGWQTVGATASPLPGPSGNVEYFLWLRAETERGLHGDELDAAVRGAVAEGPQ
jgi:23S rRNA (cytidine1920-2'-O)/16S rRNA (cytidine1409-2'-O)-methyltransferase